MLSCLYASYNLFIISILGLCLSRKNIIIIIISLELLLLSANMNFIFGSVFLDDFLGQIYSLMIFCIGAAESSLGLALITIYYRLRGGISINLICLLKA